MVRIKMILHKTGHSQRQFCTRLFSAKDSSVKNFSVPKTRTVLHKAFQCQRQRQFYTKLVTELHADSGS